jgi:hypothetical protein
MTHRNEPARQGTRTAEDAEDAYAAIARQLVADSGPVRRLAPLPARVALCLLASVCALGVFALVGPRPDLAIRLTSWPFVVETMAFAAASIVVMTLALRGAVPDRAPSAGVWGLTAGVAVFTAIGALGHPVDPGTPIRTFLQHGIPCALGTLGLAAIPGAAILLGLRRGVPLAPARSGALAGAAALLLAYLAMRLHCPIDEGLHLLAWHATPIVPIITATSGIGVLCLRG